MKGQQMIQHLTDGELINLIDSCTNIILDQAGTNSQIRKIALIARKELEAEEALRGHYKRRTNNIFGSLVN